MKLSRSSKLDSIIPTEKWKCFDNCPVCIIMKKAIVEGREIFSKELERAFAEAETEEASV